jgi:hypothetical protein
MIGELILSSYTYDVGRIAINNAFSGQASFNTFSAETIYSGSTDLYDIFDIKGSGDITRVQPGTNITTGGTENSPTVNLVDSPFINNFTASGNTSLQTVSATTFVSGSTDLYDIFSIKGSVASSDSFQVLTDAATIVWGVDISLNAVVTLGDNRALSITGLTDGDSGTLIVKQDGTGGRTLSLASTPGTHKIVNGGGGTIILSENANSEDIISFLYYTGTTTFYWNVGYNYN